MAIANTIIQVKKSGVSGNVPSSLGSGELALNFADHKLFYKNASGGTSYFYGANNGPSFATVSNGTSLIVASTPNDTLTFAAGSGVTVVSNSSTKTVTISSTGGGGSSSGYLANSIIFANSTGYLSNVSNLQFTNSNTLTLNGLLSVNYIAGAGNQNAVIQLSGANTKGGVGYTDFLWANNLSGTSNTSKYFRIDSTGQFQIINSAYTQNIFNLNDSGYLAVQSFILNNGGGGSITFADGTVQTTAASGAATDSYARQTANSAFDKANSANILAQSSYSFANTVNVFTQSAYTQANSANILAQSAFNQANSANILAQGAFTFANTVNTYSYSAYSTANSAQSNTVITQGVDSTQNTWISSNATFTQSAFTQANNALSNTGSLITVNGSSQLVIANTTVSTSNTTGSLVVAGGVGITGNLFVGGANTIVLGQNSGNTSANIVTGVVTGNWANVYIGTSTTGQTPFSSIIIGSSGGGTTVQGNFTSTGSFIQIAQNTGGPLTLGLAAAATVSGQSKTVNIGTSGVLGSNTNINIGTNGGGNTSVNFGNNAIVNITNTLISTSNTTGALVVRGGVGITGNVYAGAIYSNNALVLTSEPIGQASYDFSNTVNVFTQSAYTTANTANNTANVAAANITVLFAIDGVQNTSIGAAFDKANSANVLAQSAFDKANTTNVFTQSAYAFANTVNTYAYSANTFLQANDASTLTSAKSYTDTANTGLKSYVDQANTGMASYVLSTNNAVTGYVTGSNTAMKAYVDQANTGLKSYGDATYYTKTGGTISGSVSISNDLTVTGNLTVLGNNTVINTTSIVLNDPLLYLANNNYSTDAVDIGLIGHYNATQNAHTGIFRDPNLKEWIFFKEYTPEVSSNNLINIADPSFTTSNVYAGFFKGNLVGNTATVGGIELGAYSQAAYAQANSEPIGTAAFSKANSANVLAQAAFDKANTTNVFTQSAYTFANTVNVFTQSAFTQANSANVLAQSAFDKANTTNVFTQSAYSFANTVNVFTQSAYAQANSEPIGTAAFSKANSANVLAQAAFDKANTSSGGSSNSFSTILVSGQPNVIANTPTSPLTLVAGSGITITTVGTSNTITFASTGGFSGGTITNALNIANSIASTSNITGALVVAGGVGVSGSIWAGNIHTTSPQVSLGGSAADSAQGTNAIAIGNASGGFSAGTGLYQGTYAVAIGDNAGALGQGSQAISIGLQSGNINQGNYAVAVGPNAGYNTQGVRTVAIGLNAGSSNQGDYAVAIGNGAGSSSQPTNSIILNSGLTALNGVNSGLYINPVRNDTANTANIVYYNATTKELTYAPPSSSGGGITITDAYLQNMFYL